MNYIAAATTGGFTLIAGLIVGLYVAPKTQKFWGDFTPQTSHYCESDRIGTAILQPSNSYTNIFFYMFGFYMLIDGIMKRDLYSMVNGVQQLYAGISSFIFHASFSPIGYSVDISSVYGILYTPVCYSLGQLFKCPRLVLLSFPLDIISYFYSSQISDTFGGSENFIIFLISLIFFYQIIWIEIRKPKNLEFKWLIATFITILSGFSFRIEDEKHCAPHGAIQYHALWHTLASISMVCLWRFFLSEDKENVYVPFKDIVLVEGLEII